MNTYNEVKIEKYDSRWPEIFREESEKIIKILGLTGCGEIHHIGSSAIPDMPAKPVIDIILEFNDLNEIHVIEEKLSKINYCAFRRHVIPHYSFFSRKHNEHISFNLHIRERGDPQINRHVHFKDYLIHHPDDAKKYAHLKIELAEKFYSNRNSYTSGKEKFIQSIDRKAKIWTQRRKIFLPANTDLQVTKVSKEAIVKAIEANIIVFKTHLAQYLEITEFKREPEYTLVLNTVLKDDHVNFILETDFLEENADEIITEAKKHFENKNLPYCWWVLPNDKPKNISVYLEKNGLINTDNNLAMYFDLDTWNEETHHLQNFEIKKVNNKQGLKDFASVLANQKSDLDNYFSEIAKILTDEDPMEYYVGYLNGKPIVSGIICFFGRVAGFHGLTTLPSERKKGYGTAMQQFRFKRAKESGYHTAVLQSSNDGASLYLKLGWKPIGVFKEFRQLNNEEKV